MVGQRGVGGLLFVFVRMGEGRPFKSEPFEVAFGGIRWHLRSDFLTDAFKV